MATVVVKSIGTSGRDYSMLQSWEDACPADLVSADQVWKGECYNDSEFTSATLVIAGQTTDATRFVWLTAADGHSFIDHPDVQTNPLRYDQSKGVGIVGNDYTLQTLVSVGTNYTIVERLQIHRNGGGAYNNDTCLECGAYVAGVVIRDCIFRKSNGSGAAKYVAQTGGGKFVNCVIYNEMANGNGVGTFVSGSLYNCTVVATAGGTGTGVRGAYHSGVVKNCAFFGFGTAESTINSGNSSYNATDASSFAGSNNQTSLSISACFESTTNDFRLKSGSPLIGVGNTDATNAPNDIIGTVRGTGTDGDIGAWEYVAGGGGGGNLTLTGETSDLSLSGQSSFTSTVLTGSNTDISLSGQSSTSLLTLSGTNGTLTLTPQDSNFSLGGNLTLTGEVSDLLLTGQTSTVLVSLVSSNTDLSLISQTATSNLTVNTTNASLSLIGEDSNFVLVGDLILTGEVADLYLNGLDSQFVLSGAVKGGVSRNKQKKQKRRIQQQQDTSDLDSLVQELESEKQQLKEIKEEIKEELEEIAEEVKEEVQTLEKTEEKLDRLDILSMRIDAVNLAIGNINTQLAKVMTLVENSTSKVTKQIQNLEEVLIVLHEVANDDDD